MVKRLRSRLVHAMRSSVHAVGAVALFPPALISVMSTASAGYLCVTQGSEVEPMVFITLPPGACCAAFFVAMWWSEVVDTCRDFALAWRLSAKR